MTWRDDSWKDSYDEWKLRSPYDDGPEEDECCHVEYEANSEGRATCDQCGHSWWMTTDEIAREREHVAAYDAMIRREERREWIEGWVNWLAFWRRRRKPSLIDDEIPF